MSGLLDRLRSARTDLAQHIAELHFRKHPDLADRYGPGGFEHCLKDAHYHLQYLEQALRVSQPQLFADYARWAKVMLERRSVPVRDLVSNLELVREVVIGQLPELAEPVQAMIDEALQSLHSALQQEVEENEPHSALADAYLRAILDGDRMVASKLIHEAVQSGVPLKDIYLHVFQPAQYELGHLWQRNEIGVAEEHLATAITQMVMAQLYPRLFAGPRRKRTMVSACVGGELHEIGARMVADFFEMAGWSTYYLGANTPVSGIVRNVCDRRADVAGISVTISYYVSEAEEVIRRIRDDAGCRNTKIIVGGYPFRVAPELWKSIGADGFAADAAGAVELAEQLTASIEE